MAEAQDHIEDHGMALDKEKKRVKCKYCEKELSGFNRLKHHLGDVGSDVLGCEQVPADIKARMRQSLLDLKTERLRREVGELFHPTLPLKRTFSPTSNEAHENGLHKTMKPASSGAAQNLGDSKPTYTYGFANGGSSATFSVEGAPSVVMSKTEEDGPVNYASKCISRFFSDAGIDAIATTYPSFQRMISSIIGCGTQYKAPSYHDLKGRVFQEEAREVRRHVEEVRHSWSQTVHMAEDRHKRLIVQQLDNYRTAAGGFGDWTSDERMTCPPDLWWAEHGGHSPELQRFAVRILSQTCIGASRYELNRSLSEQLHRKGRNPVDQQILGEVEFVQHNLRLWQSPFFGRDGSDCFVLQKFDPMNDWVGGWDASTPMDPDHGGVNIAVKIEQ
ncbi:hypothetical protein QJS04_geneDACA004178 [Acorus gramineus]|uniref:C2H2-type domain-containing protein n=1 Tax=Acorus gramineus TaxID=55184 RepID=A0AAV9BDL8_ACOGR|nr:hypothetical protein QJS04_geneDACA004178 [Acorus gramineus]